MDRLSLPNQAKALLAFVRLGDVVRSMASVLPEAMRATPCKSPWRMRKVKIQARTGKKVIKSFHPWEIDQAMKSAADIVLFDNMCPGSRALYDYSVLSGFPRPFIVAGGLSPDNVSEVISTLNPFAVDVSSSVESMGFKDYGKTSSFIKEARRVL